MKSAICSAIVLCVLLVPPLPLVLPVLPVVLVPPVLLVVPDLPWPCGDLSTLALAPSPEPSEPPQAAVISATDAQSVAPIKVRVPRESAMLSSTFSKKKEKHRAPPDATAHKMPGDDEITVARRNGTWRANATPRKKCDGTAIAHAERAVNGRIGRPSRCVPRRAHAARSSMPKLTAIGQSADVTSTQCK
ncbi:MULTISPECIES: hypothetical protein [Burkholderia]|uniref:hypothetical protein n=1 Tax=Burkholderia TaxID=32008 RepID=UPI001CF7CE7E|nr:MULTISPECIES: hypothetical protein [Burkholderia]